MNADNLQANLTYHVHVHGSAPLLKAGASLQVYPSAIAHLKRMLTG